MESMDGATFTAIRHLLGVGTQELAELLPAGRDGRSVGTRTLRDWAAGTLPIPPRIADHMWMLLDQHTHTVEHLPPAERFLLPRRYPGLRDGLPHSWWIGVAARHLERYPTTPIHWDTP
ncbi:MAG: hypothetical protein Q4D96_09330 [Propionibacteriaceae bacterium]|nr:hypothetical protein [Propionibacteriaceae bacterium]